MSKGAQKTLAKTSQLPFPNVYVQALLGEYSSWAFSEEKAPLMKGQWRQEIHGHPEEGAIDLEIGTGNGFHFAHYTQNFPQRGVVGVELKYKPLIQSIRRARSTGSTNMRMIRYNAVLLEDLFEDQELNHVFIHFPDPWSKKGQKKHRLIQQDFLKVLFKKQRTGSFLEFKTDNRDYFDWAVERFRQSDYKEEFITYNLHQSNEAPSNFVTAFESYFLREGLPIHYIRLRA